MPPVDWETFDVVRGKVLTAAAREQCAVVIERCTVDIVALRPTHEWYSKLACKRGTFCDRPPIIINQKLAQPSMRTVLRSQLETYHRTCSGAQYYNLDQQSEH